MLRKTLMFLVPVALAACASGPQGSASPGAGEPSTAKAERPVVKVGDRWKFVCTGSWGHDRLWVVTSVDSAGVKGTENGQPLALTPDLNEIETPRSNHSDYRWLSFPLEVNKQWKVKTHWGMSGYTGTEEFEVTVVGYEKVRVPAGEFDAFKLKYRSTWSAEGDGVGSNSNTYWYAPATRAIVKYELWSSGTASDACELVEFQLQP
jgi:hypothetical protein